MASATSYASSSTWRRERVVGLLGVPRAAAGAAQPLARARRAARTRAATAARRCRRTRDVRWSGSTSRSRSASATVEHVLVGQAEPLEHRHRRARARATSSSASFTSESTKRGVALRDEQRPAKPGGVDRERARVDDARAARAGRCRGAPTRDRRTTAPGTISTVDVARAAQQQHRALGDGRAAGHGVHDFAVRRRAASTTRVDDRARRPRRDRRRVVQASSGSNVDALARRAPRPPGDARSARSARGSARTRRAPRAARGRRRPGRARPRRPRPRRHPPGDGRATVVVVVVGSRVARGVGASARRRPAADRWSCFHVPYAGRPSRPSSRCAC